MRIDPIRGPADHRPNSSNPVSLNRPFREVFPQSGQTPPLVGRVTHQEKGDIPEGVFKRALKS